MVLSEKRMKEEIQHMEKMNHIADNRYQNVYRIEFFANEKKVHSLGHNLLFFVAKQIFVINSLLCWG